MRSTAHNHRAPMIRSRFGRRHQARLGKAETGLMPRPLSASPPAQRLTNFHWLAGTLETERGNTGQLCVAPRMVTKAKNTQPNRLVYVSCNRQFACTQFGCMKSQPGWPVSDELPVCCPRILGSMAGGCQCAGQDGEVRSSFYSSAISTMKSAIGAGPAVAVEA